LECAQQHVNLVAQESDGVVHILNEKLDVLDRIATNTRQKIVTERDKIVKQVDAERDRSFALLAEMIEEEKQQIRDKNKELNELPLNEVPEFIRQLKTDVQPLLDNNDSFFVVNSSAPQITLRRQNEQRNIKPTTGNNSTKSSYSNDDYEDYNKKPISRSKYDDEYDNRKPTSTRSKYGEYDEYD
jgi:hypothetical protein